jgi:hypothetical protein
MTSHKVNWEKVKELGIKYIPQTFKIKKNKYKKIQYKRNVSTFTYKWCDGQLLKFNIKSKTYSNY